jgi:hypothetical protein
MNILAPTPTVLPDTQTRRLALESIRQEIHQQTTDFLSTGGTVSHVPFGVSSINPMNVKKRFTINPKKESDWGKENKSLFK